MQICSDPLETVRCLGPKYDWRVTLPACYPTFQPYQPFTHDGNNQQDSSKINAESLLIQHFREKIQLHQTPTSNDTRQILQRLNNIIQKHVPDFVLKDLRDDYSSDQTSQSTSVSADVNGKKSGQSSSSSRQLFGKYDSNHTLLNEDNPERSSIVTRISVPGTPQTSDHQMLGTPLRQAVSDMIKSNDSSTSMSGSNTANLDSRDFQQSSSNRSLKSEKTLSRDHLGSSTSRTSRESLLTLEKSRKTSNRRKNWLLDTLSRKLSKLTSSQDLSRESHSPSHLIDQLKISDALASFEPTLTKETFEALINKKKDLQNQGLMYWLRAPIRCCRTCRTQRRLAAAAQRSINMAIKNVSSPS